MKELVRLEEIALFGLGVFLFSILGYSWWWFFGLLLAPDLSMFGYLINEKMGAWIYNLFHHRALAIIVLLVGWFMDYEIALVAGLILFSHASLDRIFGYGLKYERGFKYTHLGKIGKR
ncbi:DUF4260 domain-containing protein [Myroides guanonis]|uniref:DUF4260 domain-containing protein n=1 Tax=Myroides guanonis TaxID=1150112 RepID=A0A1I3SD07_9FLAO|nr:DUF4260 domain-containing protein [Myroides guanonis]SFJ56615.1 protein of unknown function [Myroides guanonis]